MPFLHIAKGLPSCLPSSSTVINFQSIGVNFRQKVAKVNIYLLDFVSPRENRRQQTAKSKHIFEMQEGKRAEMWPAVCLSSCPLVQRSAGFRGFRTCHRLALVLRWCAPSFLSAFLLPFPAPPFKYALFRVLKGFLARFGVRMYICMG